MNLLDRFSSHLRDVLARSIHLATELQNEEVEPIHLFFCLSGQKGAVAAELIGRFKVSPKSLEQAVLAIPSKARTSSASTLEKTITPLSPSAKLALEKALVIAQENAHNYIGSEHLLAALVRINDTIIDDVLKVNSVNMDDFKKQVDTVLGNATHFPHMNEIGEVVERIQDNLNEQMGPEMGEPMPEAMKRGSKRKESALEFFGTHLTDPEAQKNIDPVIGRESEIERVIQILCRRTKNNPLLLGEPGVGKTAIVEGLAKRIVEGAVPELLLNKKIYSLDMGMMIAGTIYRGEFEARLRQVIDEAVSNPNIILFIDEVHNIVGAGSNQGTMDASNILKPPLSRGQIRCIGATTPAEFKKYIENDAALERRFQPVIAKEPSLADTMDILRGIKKNYEAYHAITITDEAVVAAAKLADRYIAGKFMPDKAIDLLDETAASKRLHAKTPPAQSKLLRLQQKLEKTILEKEEAASQDDFKKAVELKKQEERLRAEVQKNTSLLEKKKPSKVGSVDARDVAVQVARIIGTSPRELLLDDMVQLERLEERLKEYVVGQDAVIHEVSQLIQQAKLGLSNPDRPLASFLFVGESGVGKTELAKSLAKVLYTTSDALIKLDMSEFGESFSTSKLLGSPAGYVGYKESNQFKIKMNPYCVVLFDEIDKAHRDVVKLLLQMLENGEITDSTGKKISLRHATIVLTTSFGADDMKRGKFGFGTNDAKHTDASVRATEKLKEYFSPEVLNRLDRICFFEPLTPATLVRIAELELHRFNERLKEYQTTVTSSAHVLEELIAGLPKNESGAREVRRAVRSQVEALISHAILRSKVKPSYRLGIKNHSIILE